MFAFTRFKASSSVVRTKPNGFLTVLRFPTLSYASDVRWASGSSTARRRFSWS
ncbi:MAG TPA: hypothetical protein VGX76_14175 [Pirellulales bacterium]|jgi:hypothetical protein|nr:hypothetical protein [Pirellulales bacterium]